jgi:hypothetical protein
MLDDISIRPMYVDSSHLFNLLGKVCLQSPLIEFFRRERIVPFYRLAAEGRLKAGALFTYQGRCFAKGFGTTDQSLPRSLSENVDDILPETKLMMEISTLDLRADSQYLRQKGAKNLFLFCELTQIEDKLLRAKPIVIGDLVMRTIDQNEVKLIDNIRLNVQDVDAFMHIDFERSITRAEINQLRDIPKDNVKALVCKLLGQSGARVASFAEEGDFILTNVSLRGKSYRASIWVVDHSEFRKLSLADFGPAAKKIDQFFRTNAEVFILQHSQSISTAVRKTMDDFALSRYSSNCRLTIVDRRETAKILRAYGWVS